MKTKVRDRIRSKHDGYRREYNKIEDRIQENEGERKRIEKRIEKVDEILESMDNEKTDMYILADKLNDIAEKMERNRLQEYLDLVNNKKRLFFINFLMGMAKGFGTVIGFTILAALVLYVLQSMISIPIIGDYIADIVKIVQQNLSNK